MLGIRWNPASKQQRFGGIVLLFAVFILAICLPVFILSSGDLNKAAGWANILALPVGLFGVLLANRGAAPEQSPSAALEPSGLDRRRTRSLWTIPMPVATFAGRTNHLNQITRALAGNGVVALVGMAGAGKTQLAAQYAVSRRGDFDIGWWIAADDRVAVRTSLSRLADRLGVGNADGEVAASNALLRLAQLGRWLLFFDNAPDTSVLEECIPAGAGAIIITSRDPMWDQIAACVEVEPFDTPTAAQYLQWRTNSSDVKSAEMIAQLMGGLPLALEQAAAYCLVSGIELAGYLERFQTGRRKLLGTTVNPKQLPVWVSLGLALTNARRKNSAALHLMMILSLLAEAAEVPRAILSRNQAALPRKLAGVVSDPLRLDETLTVLRRLSLLAVERELIRVHPLVQSITRERARLTRRELVAAMPRRSIQKLRGDNSAFWKVEDWLTCVAALLVEALPADPEDPTTWDEWAVFVPHINAVLERATISHIHTPGLSDLGLAYGRYLWRRGSYSDARVLLGRLVESNTASFGAAHPNTLRVRNSFGLVLNDLGRVAEAGDVHRETLRLRRSALGSDHPETLTSINNLACLLRARGDLPAARELHQESFDTRTRTLGSNHPKTLLSLDNLALVVGDMGEASLAESMHREAVAGFLVVLGADHPRTLEATDNLGLAMRHSGNFELSVMYHRTASDGRSTVLGEEHPDTLISMYNLANALEDTGASDDAVALHRRVLTMRQRSLGEDHPDTQQSHARVEAL